VTAEDSIDRLKQWHAQFKTLLSPETPPVRSNLHLPKVFRDLPFRTGEFTKEELDTVLSTLSALSSDKAAGVDEIVNEILRRPKLSDCILEILNMCYLSKSVPNEWHFALLNHSCVHKEQPFNHVYQLPWYCPYVRLCQALQLTSPRTYQRWIGRSPPKN